MRNASYHYALSTILFLTLLAALPNHALGQPRMIGEIFQGQPPPPGAISVMGRAFIEAGETGFGNALTLLLAASDQNMRQEIGLTDTEVNSIRLVQTQMLMNAPQYASRFNAMTEETQKNVQDDLVRDMGRIAQSLNTALPQERKDNVQKFVFQAMGGLDSPFVNLSAMEALNLSPDQRTTLQGVFDEMREERMGYAEKIFSGMEKVTAAGGLENMSEADQEEMRRMGQELETAPFETARRLAERLRRHLTPEQLELERQLIASRPAFLPGLPRQMRDGRENADGAGEYAPGADSWRPGRELPTQIQRPQPGRFPRPE
ncbi:MAG: hypothetical protein FWG73_08740 [Planctomycetaceae bacterium]|nr:hypothetical protein [Planctomycetaceae bacterium]